MKQSMGPQVVNITIDEILVNSGLRKIFSNNEQTFSCDPLIVMFINVIASLISDVLQVVKGSHYFLKLNSRN